MVKREKVNFLSAYGTYTTRSIYESVRCKYIRYKQKLLIVFYNLEITAAGNNFFLSRSRDSANNFLFLIS
ncbi:MAG TPA: hypothetical protein DEB17_02730 [Chlorobaculum sp.]|uniref:Uncharacterized protein n=1 Tax=Chlorobaculum tepidum (strain ATCC 49652 / DSM 12025 / NBRC 103806 / TLS) TaxID=194439 RepID=Q8KED9_CHLTE|nr:hypothetical protein CT0750 [Chlorobaculum tepidum TLS]HBU22907.1 hypothetical protein [Chlorobaculum sp.]